MNVPREIHMNVHTDVHTNVHINVHMKTYKNVLVVHIRYSY